MKEKYQYTPIMRAVLLTLALSVPVYAQAQTVIPSLTVQGVNGNNTTGANDVQTYTGDYEIQGNVLVNGGSGTASAGATGTGGNALLDINGAVSTTGDLIITSGASLATSIVDGATTAQSGDAELRVGTNLNVGGSVEIGWNGAISDADQASAGWGPTTSNTVTAIGGNTKLHVGGDMTVVGDMSAMSKISYAESRTFPANTIAASSSGNVSIDITGHLTVGNDLSVGTGEASFGTTAGGAHQGSTLTGDFGMTVGGDLQVGGLLSITRGIAYSTGHSNTVSGTSGKVVVNVGQDAIIGNGFDIVADASSTDGNTTSGSHSAYGQGVEVTVGRDVLVQHGNMNVRMDATVADDWGTSAEGVARSDDMRVTVGRDLTVADGSMIVMAGDGVRANSISTNSSANAGSVIVDVGGRLSVLGPGALQVNSGNIQANAAPNTNITAGNASITAAELIALNVAFIKNDGDLTARFGALNMANNSTDLTLDGTVAWNGTSGVQFGDLTFGAGQGLTVTSANGGTMFAGGNITVSGGGAVYNSPVAYDASGKNLTFTLPDNVVGGDTMLSTPQAGVDVSSAHVTLKTGGELRSLQGGDRITLISQTTGQVSNMGEQTVMWGATGYRFNVLSNPSDLQAEYLSSAVDSGSAKAYAEALLGSTIALNNGADLIIGEGYNNAEQAILNPERVGVFMAGEANHIKANSGSHVSSDGYDFLAGVAWGTDFADAHLMLAPLVEYGKGNYSTHNSFATGRVRGSGDTKYWGAGILGRMSFDSGFYAEASVRGGRVENDYNAYSLIDGRYDTSATYWSAHAGAGYLWPVNQDDVIDTSLKVLWTRQDSDKTMTAAQEYLEFDAVNSVRSRLGARYTHQLNNTVQLYGGAAWEYEADGRVKSTLDGFRVDRPDIGGHTAIVEAGLNWQATEQVRLNLGVQALDGKREGAKGTVYFNYTF